MFEAYEDCGIEYHHRLRTPELHNRNLLSEQTFQEAANEIRTWDGYNSTRLHLLEQLAGKIGVGSIWYKDEGSRFGVGSFKALGAPYAGLKLLQKQISATLGKPVSLEQLRSPEFEEYRKNVTLVAATDGNHGRSLAWGANLFGAPCKIYIHQHVSENRAQSISAYGAEVIRVDGDYDHSVEICRLEAEKNGWHVVSDTSWEGYTEPPEHVMAGYGLMVDEICEQIGKKPTHLFVQGGVGGLAAAVSRRLSQVYREHSIKMVIVEPDLAPCLYESARSGRATNVRIEEETAMAGLSCGEPSILAWQIIEHLAEDFITIPESLVAPSMKLLARPLPGDASIVAGESAIAGLAALIAAAQQDQLRDRLQLDQNSSILLIGSEGATDPEIYEAMINS